jgi:hypothetical protein
MKSVVPSCAPRASTAYLRTGGSNGFRPAFCVIAGGEYRHAADLGTIQGAVLGLLGLLLSSVNEVLDDHTRRLAAG